MDPLIITSPLLAGLGLPHGFTTRAGGVSAGVFATLNFGNPSDLPDDRRDPRTNIAENWRRALLAGGAIGRRVEQSHQVHGGRVLELWRGLPDDARAEPGDTPDPKADALVTDDPTRVVAVRVADCAPVLVATDDGRVVAAVHAGWRGVVAGVLPAAIASIRQRRPRARLVAAIGPCIGGGRSDAFEVGPEVVAAFRDALGSATASVRERPDGKGVADLQAALQEQARRAGVEALDTIARCTVAEPAAFFSHRRDRGHTGRMAAFIGPAAS